MTPQQIDTSLQTSFIPKAPQAPLGATQKRPKKTPLLLYLGIFVFVAGALFSGGVYGLRQLATQDVTELENSLARVQQVVTPESLDTIEAVDAQLAIGKQVFEQHRSTASIFRFLEQNTLPGIAYSTFGYQGGSITLAGQAESYEVIAQQSDLFSNNAQIEDHIFSGFTLSEFGRVSFSLTINPIASLVQYIR